MSDVDNQPLFWTIKSQCVKATPEFVTQVHDLPSWAGERPLTPKRVEFLDARRQQGLFHPPHWATAEVAMPDGTTMTYRINAQHSSEMLIRLLQNGGLPESLTIHHDHFGCSNMTALALLFRQYDDRRSSRPPSDVAGAYQGLEADLHDVARPVGKMGIEAICWYRRNVLGEMDTVTDDDRYTLFAETQHHPFLLWLSTQVGKMVPAELRRVPIVAAMYSTYLVGADDAGEFWGAVMQGPEYGDADASTTLLAEWLQSLYQGEFKVNEKQAYQGCIYAWNAMRRGVRIRSIRPTIRNEKLSVAED